MCHVRHAFPYSGRTLLAISAVLLSGLSCITEAYYEIILVSTQNLSNRPNKRKHMAVIYVSHHLLFHRTFIFIARAAIGTMKKTERLIFYV